MVKEREIGDEAVWSLSTAKSGNGVDQLRDNNMETYWQSDGPQPHLINVQFHKKTKISSIGICLDYKLDESYTPKKLSIRSGNTLHDLKEIQTLEIKEPQGIVTIALDNTSNLSKTENGEKCIKTFFLQICIIAMHQNGRDTHVRQVKIYTPQTDISCTLKHVWENIPVKEDSVLWNQFDCIR